MLQSKAWAFETSGASFGAYGYMLTVVRWRYCELTRMERQWSYWEPIEREPMQPVSEEAQGCEPLIRIRSSSLRITVLDKTGGAIICSVYRFTSASFCFDVFSLEEYFQSFCYVFDRRVLHRWFCAEIMYCLCRRQTYVICVEASDGRCVWYMCALCVPRKWRRL